MQKIVPQRQVLPKLQSITKEVVQQYFPWINIQLKQENTYIYPPQGGTFIGKGPGMLGGQLAQALHF